MTDEPVPQFYGKWPFASYSLPLASVIPMQEPASVAFSLMNMFSAFRLYKGASRLPRSATMKIVWKNYAVIGVVTWIFSASFHWSDFWLTEYLDYFSAFAVITYAFFTSISLVLAPFQRNRLIRICWRILFIVFVYYYIRHVWSLTTYFDYGYNMWCCLTCSFLTAAIYVFWLLVQWRLRSKEDRQSLVYLAAAVIWGLGSALLEMFDFPPILWIIDAHSLFHLATVPIPLLLLRFIELENASESQRLDGYAKFA